MKTIIALLLLTASVYAQQNDTWKNFDTLISGVDSLVIDTSKTFNKYLVVTVTDSGVAVASGGIDDSVFVEVYDPKLAVWVRVGVRNLLDFTDYPAAVPGSGNTRDFLVLYPAFSSGSMVRLRKGNATYTAGVRTLTALRWVNNW
jgi:hypothetical protein